MVGRGGGNCVARLVPTLSLYLEVPQTPLQVACYPPPRPCAPQGACKEGRGGGAEVRRTLCQNVAVHCCFTGCNVSRMWQVVGYSLCDRVVAGSPPLPHVVIISKASLLPLGLHSLVWCVCVCV